MTPDEKPTVKAGRSAARGTVFWKVAVLLVGVQVVIGLFAVGLSAYFAYDASLELVRNSLRLRLDGLAEEVELRVPALEQGLTNAPRGLLDDIATRFPDPVSLVGADGQAILTVMPDPMIFPEVRGAGNATPLPANVGKDLAAGEVVVSIGERDPIGIAPVYDATGFLAGGVVVYPLTNSVARELAETRAGFYRALVVITILAGLVALLIGAVLTWRIIRPLRSIAGQVERIGLGDYSARIASVRDDEFGRLAEAVNVMAQKVEDSFEALKSTDRLRRDLVANIGHDLRTPLTAMRGYIDEANRAMREGDAETAIDMLETASQQTIYMSSLVTDLFELSLLDSPNPPLHLEPVPMGELVLQAAEGQYGLFRDSGQRLKVEIPEGLPVIRADGVRLLRLINNLLDNARKYGRSGGSVTVTVRVDAPAVEVTVSDDGPGISPELVPTLFDRYYRGEGARTRKDSGTGLGLAICRAIAEAHGGRLTVSSEFGIGSQFVLRIPLSGR